MTIADREGKAVPLSLSTGPFRDEAGATLGAVCTFRDLREIDWIANAGENLFVLDVRDPDEFKAGHVEGAVNIPIRTLAQNVSKLPQDKATPISVVCKSGIRAAYGTMA